MGGKCAVEGRIVVDGDDRGGTGFIPLSGFLYCRFVSGGCL